MRSFAIFLFLAVVFGLLAIVFKSLAPATSDSKVRKLGVTFQRMAIFLALVGAVPLLIVLAVGSGQ